MRTVAPPSAARRAVLSVEPSSTTSTSSGAVRCSRSERSSVGRTAASSRTGTITEVLATRSGAPARPSGRARARSQPPHSRPVTTMRTNVVIDGRR